MWSKKPAENGGGSEVGYGDIDSLTFELVVGGRNGDRG